MSARIEVFPERHKRAKFAGGAVVHAKGDPTGQWLFRLVGANGEPMAVSQAYSRKTSAKRGARRFLQVAGLLEAGRVLDGADPIEEVER